MASNGLAKTYFEKLQEAERRIFELTEAVADRDKQLGGVHNPVKEEDGGVAMSSEESSRQCDLQAQLNAALETEANLKDQLTHPQASSSRSASGDSYTSSKSRDMTQEVYKLRSELGAEKARSKASHDQVIQLRKFMSDRDRTITKLLAEKADAEDLRRQVAGLNRKITSLTNPAPLRSGESSAKRKRGDQGNHNGTGTPRFSVPPPPLPKQAPGYHPPYAGPSYASSAPISAPQQTPNHTFPPTSIAPPAPSSTPDTQAIHQNRRVLVFGFPSHLQQLQISPFMRTVGMPVEGCKLGSCGAAELTFADATRARSAMNYINQGTTDGWNLRAYTG